jgi:hypothetical protein
MRDERAASERTPRHWIPACAGMTPSTGDGASPAMDSRLRGNDVLESERRRRGGNDAPESKWRRRGGNDVPVDGMPPPWRDWSAPAPR